VIQLTRLNSQLLAVNSDLIKFVEQAPDTVVTLLSGEKILVRETAEQIIQRILQFRRAVLEGLCIDATAALCLGSVHPSLIKPSAGEEPRG
jgi:flagellar protein FlbD